MPITIEQGYLGALYLSPPGWTPQDLTDEPMQHVDLTAEGRPLYTVYEIADATKRYLDDSATPVFTASTTGALTPYKVEYPGARIYLTTALGSGETVVCTSGHYVPVEMVQGVIDYNFAGKWKTIEKRFLRDTATRNIMVENAWECTANLASVNTRASLTTALVGDHNDIIWTHEIGGSGGNGATGGYTVHYDDPGGVTTALSITIAGNNITVNLARAASAITTTANDIVALAAANAILRERKVTAKLAQALGTGLVTALAQANLSGGLDPYDFPGIEGKCVAVFYDNYDTDGRWEDFGVIPNGSLKIDPTDLETKTITIKQYGGLRSGPFYRKS
jgi:hypothetical protein